MYVIVLDDHINDEGGPRPVEILCQITGSLSGNVPPVFRTTDAAFEALAAFKKRFPAYAKNSYRVRPVVVVG